MCPDPENAIGQWLSQFKVGRDRASHFDGIKKAAQFVCAPTANGNDLRFTKKRKRSN